VLMWYARDLKFLRWPAIALNVAVLAAIPIQGGHHLVDAFGGAAVTALSIALSAWIVSAAAKRAKTLPQEVPALAGEPAGAR